MLEALTCAPVGKILNLQSKMVNMTNCLWAESVVIETTKFWYKFECLHSLIVTNILTKTRSLLSMQSDKEITTKRTHTYGIVVSKDQINESMENIYKWNGSSKLEVDGTLPIIKAEFP